MINALENIRSAKEMALAHNSQTGANNSAIGLINQATEETKDGLSVLAQGGLHPKSVDNLDEALEHFEDALEEDNPTIRKNDVNAAVALLDTARNDMVMPQ